ncbi:MAG: hypothetical protein IKE58_11760 [Blautia sp.]|nr:hypothetical protein [Blautia sp.]
METCISCQQNSSCITFHALEVQTLPVRGFTGENRVQALGSFHDFSVCRDCAAKRLEKDLAPFSACRSRSLKFGAVLLAGLGLAMADFTILNTDRVFLMLSLAAIACGLIGAVQSYREAAARAKELSAMKKEKALSHVAWEIAAEKAPKKYKDSDLTYIPVTSATLAMKNGDLMIAYHLLPAIAVEACKRIHQERSAAVKG